MQPERGSTTRKIGYLPSARWASLWADFLDAAGGLAILIRMANYSQRSLDAVFSALSDSTRRGMLERLSRGEASVTELAAPFGVALPTIHKHLRVLERAGFIAHEKRGRVRHVRLTQASGRRCQAEARVNLAPIAEVKSWLARLEARWDEHLQRLKRQVESGL
jgi:DNA-binding transcriptional ArsR family regulator